MNRINLMILPDGDRQLQIFLQQSSNWVDMSPPPSVNVVALRRQVDNQLQDVMRRVEKDATISAKMPLRTIGRRLYNMLVSRQLDQILQAVIAAGGEGETVLCLHTRVDWIPWELMHDGHDYLGVRLPISRLPIVPTSLDMITAQPRQVQDVFNILGEHVLTNDELVTKWEDTFSPLLGVGKHEHRFPSQNGVTRHFPSLDDLALAEGQNSHIHNVDILHITCHGGIEAENGELYWSLNHKGWESVYRIDSLSLDIISEGLMIPTTRPLIFGNACASAKSNETKVGELLLSFGEFFFTQGATAFIGTFAPVTKKLAVDFARRFYQQLLAEGLPLAQALWATKKHYADHKVSDPSWMYYCLYGPPEVQFQL